MQWFIELHVFVRVLLNQNFGSTVHKISIWMLYIRLYVITFDFQSDEWVINFPFDQFDKQNLFTINGSYIQGLWCRYVKGNSIFNTTFSISMTGYFFKYGMKKWNDIYQKLLLAMSDLVLNGNYTMKIKSLAQRSISKCDQYGTWKITNNST